MWYTIFLVGLSVLFNLTLAQVQKLTSYQNTFREDSHKFTEPLWRAEADAIPYASCQTCLTLGDTQIFHLYKGALVARDIATGNELWQFGKNIKKPAQYGKGFVFVVEERRVVVLNAINGQVRWTFIVENNPNENTDAEYQAPIFYAGDKLFVNDPNGLQALNASSGKVLWKHQDSYGYSKITILGSTVLANVYQRLRPYSIVKALDLQTGEFLWAYGGYGTHIQSLIYADATHAYFFQPQSLAGMAGDITQLSLRTGKVITSCSLDSDPPKFAERYHPYTSANRYAIHWATNSNSLVTDGDWVYFQARTDFELDLHRLPLCGTTSESEQYTKQKILLSYQNIGKWLAGPYKDAVLFGNEQGLRLVRLDPDGQHKGFHEGNDAVIAGYIATGWPEYYPGIVSPVARLDIIDDLLLVGTSNKTFQVSELLSQRVLLKTSTNSRKFAQSYLIDDFVLVQAGKEILAYKLER